MVCFPCSMRANSHINPLTCDDGDSGYEPADTFANSYKSEWLQLEISIHRLYLGWENFLVLYHLAQQGHYSWHCKCQENTWTPVEGREKVFLFLSCAFQEENLKSLNSSPPIHPPSKREEKMAGWWRIAVSWECTSPGDAMAMSQQAATFYKDLELRIRKNTPPQSVPHDGPTGSWKLPTATSKGSSSPSPLTVCETYGRIMESQKKSFSKYIFWFKNPLTGSYALCYLFGGKLFGIFLIVLFSLLHLIYVSLCLFKQSITTIGFIQFLIHCCSRRQFSASSQQIPTNALAPFLWQDKHSGSCSEFDQ